ncbi:HupE/UreJ family protein [Amorphus sp. 3PC139-8]|uniref:HupE/UreJ family protein n=1 Tax=Amorphus sp. 3PC139-8 TaxID=2735676 RepID=UPI00345D24A5
MKISGRFVVAAGVAVTATPALAHTGVTSTSGFSAGFGHPLGGLDHMLAMVAVGLLAAALGGRWLWALPATFLAFLVLGGIAGMSNLPLPAVELGIKGSVLVLGLAVVFGRACPAPLAAAVVAVFAFFHGHAHGTEMPATVGALDYGLGFVLATALLHLLGIAIGLASGLLPERSGQAVRQAGGAAIACLGLVLLVG